MKYRYCLLTLIMFFTAACARQDRPAIAEDFDTLGQWSNNNDNVPGKIKIVDGHLSVTDLPGGNATWGTSCYNSFEDIDIDKYRFMIAKVDEMSDGFGSKIVNRQKGEKVRVLQGLGEPGIIVEDIAKKTGWSGIIDIAVGLYAQGPQAHIEVDYLYFASSLLPKERVALRKSVQTEIVPLSGLKQLDTRKCSRPLVGEPPYPSERFIYTDPVTHARVWRMTNHPSIERHEYYDIPAWNADGSTMIFLSRRGHGRYWLMDADGANIRPFREPSDGGPMKRPRWTYTDPDRVFSYRTDDDSTTVITINVHNGDIDEVVTIPVGNLSMEPPHPDDNHFLFHRKRKQFWIVDGDTGEFTKFTLWHTHRRRFTRAPDHSIFINRNQDPDNPDVRRRTSWTCRRDGSDLTLLEEQGGGHPDWSPNGEILSYYADGGIWLVDRDGTNRRRLLKTSGGHGGFSLDGNWHVSDASHGGPFRDQIYVTQIDGDRVHRICFHHSSYQGWGSGIPDPEATHPAPISSPDCTKIVYDSDMFGQPDMWVAVWQFPEQPQNVEVSTKGNSRIINWERPAQSKELAGYNVYRKSTSEIQFTRIASLIENTQYTDNEATDGPYDYAVSMQEHSDLESPMAIHWGAGRNIAKIEIENLSTAEGEEITLDQRVGGGFYLSAVGEPHPLTINTAKLDIEKGDYLVWARVRDINEVGAGWSVTAAGETITGKKPQKTWTWRPIDQPISAQTDNANITVQVGSGLDIDQIMLTDETDFSPKGIIGQPDTAPPAPKNLTAERDGSNNIKLSWQPVDGVHHYCVYATRDPELKLGNATLVGTPTQPEFTDCGLVPASRYRYRVTAADVWSNESDPSNMAKAQTPSGEWTYLHLGAQEANTEKPMTYVEKDNLSSSGFVHVPNDYSDATYVHKGAAHLKFNAPAKDQYTFWGRTMGLNGKSNSFFVAIDDSDDNRWDVTHGKKKTVWRWTKIPGLSPVQLDAGEHVLNIKCREDGTRLDKIIVTNDPFFEPTTLQPKLQRGELLYSNDFDNKQALQNWRLEGAIRGGVKDEKLFLEAYDEGATKGVAWCPKTFKDPIEISWSYRPLTPYGLSIIFFMAQGRDGEDIFSWKRDGSFKQYIKGRMNTYHISYHRHLTDACNMRKNFGFHLVAEAIDPCRTTGQDYEISVRKFGGYIQFLVNGRLVHNWFDDGNIGGPPHNVGKIGFRHTRRLQALYDNLRVHRLVRQ